MATASSTGASFPTVGLSFATFVCDQDGGFGLSGANCANPIVSNVTMTAYADWPHSRLRHRPLVVRWRCVRRAVGVAGAEQRRRRGARQTHLGNGPFQCGAFDWVPLWLGPVSAGVVVRVYTGSRNMTAYRDLTNGLPTSCRKVMSTAASSTGPPFGCSRGGALAAVCVTTTGTVVPDADYRQRRVRGHLPEVPVARSHRRQ
jgi:hypothetical protein